MTEIISGLPIMGSFSVNFVHINVTVNQEQHDEPAPSVARSPINMLKAACDGPLLQRGTADPSQGARPESPRRRCLPKSVWLQASGKSARRKTASKHHTSLPKAIASTSLDIAIEFVAMYFLPFAG